MPAFDKVFLEKKQLALEKKMKLQKQTFQNEMKVLELKLNKRVRSSNNVINMQNNLSGSSKPKFSPDRKSSLMFKSPDLKSSSSLLKRQK